MALRPTEKPTTQNPTPPLTRPQSRIPGVAAVGPMGAAQDNGRRLIVGREIELNGAISACETLVVEGRVEASLSDSQRLEIAEGGSFKGDVEIDEAIIAGHFEGNLTARRRLVIRASGRVEGNVRYGDIEISEGGRLVGHVEELESPTPTPAANADEPAQDEATAPAGAPPQPTLIIDDTDS